MIITTVVCNKCGNDIPDSVSGGYDVGFGYGSKHDGERWSFELCEDCLLELISTFKHIPKGFYDNPYIQLSDNERQIVFEEWKKTGEFDELSVFTYDRLMDSVGYLSKDEINSAISKYYPKRPILE